jgi:hypothetical protein
MRTLRMFGYGFLAVVLVLYLAAAGLDPLAVGIVLTLTLVGDTLISLWLTTERRPLRPAPRPRRRARPDARWRARLRVTSWLPLLILAGAIGVISPTGNEVGPFLAIEQAALSPDRPGRRRTATFAWYNLAATWRPRRAPSARVSSARPARSAGGARRCLPRDRRRLRGHRIALAAGFWRLGPRIEAPPRGPRPTASAVGSGSDRSKGVVAQLSACSRSTRSAAGSSRRA